MTEPDELLDDPESRRELRMAVAISAAALATVIVACILVLLSGTFG